MNSGPTSDPAGDNPLTYNAESKEFGPPDAMKQYADGLKATADALAGMTDDKAAALAADTTAKAATLAATEEGKAAELATSLDTALAAIMQRLESLGDSLGAVAGQLVVVASREKRTRRLAVGLAVSIVLDVVLTVVVTTLSISALHEGSIIHQSQLTACTLSNQTRQAQLFLWKYIVNLSGKPETAQEKRFLVVVATTFAPLDCTRLYPG